MNEEIESGELTIGPRPNSDDELEIEFYIGDYRNEWLTRPSVLTLVKALIKTFEIKEGELNDTAK